MAQTVSDSELELMRIIWEFGGCAFYAQIAEKLAQNGNTWNKNTIITLLTRLAEKGMLKANKFGRRNQYVALVGREEYRAVQTESFVERIYEGNVRGLVATLIKKDMLTARDYEELQTFWKEGEQADE